MPRFAFFLLALLLAVPPAAQAQFDASAPAHVLTQRRVAQRTADFTYITPTGGIGATDPLIFEAQIAPWVYLFSGDTPFALLAAPQVVLRMFPDDSNPVTAPSFLPRVRLNWHFRPSRLLFSTLVSHHSNGQAGSFYRDDGSINVDTGNFSTNYIEVSLTHHQLGQDEAVGDFRAGSVFGAGILEWMRFGVRVPFLPGHHVNTEPALEGLYSFYRVHFAVQTSSVPREQNALLSTLFSAFQFRAELWWRTPLLLEDAPVWHKQFDVAATLLLELHKRSDLFAYLNFYLGEDYYNIRFQNRLGAIRFGFQANIGNFRLPGPRS